MSGTDHSLGPNFNHFGTLFIAFPGIDVDDSELVFDLASAGGLEGSSYEGGFGRSSAKAKMDGSRGAEILTSDHRSLSISHAVCVGQDIRFRDSSSNFRCNTEDGASCSCRSVKSRTLRSETLSSRLGGVWSGHNGSETTPHTVLHTIPTYYKLGWFNILTQRGADKGVNGSYLVARRESLL